VIKVSNNLSIPVLNLCQKLCFHSKEKKKERKNEMLLRKYFQKPFKYQETKKKLKEGFDDNTDMHTYTIST